MTLVLDASLTLASILHDEVTAQAQDRMREAFGQTVWVPSLWRLEVANVLRNAVRRGRCDAIFVDQALGELELLPIRIDTETDARAWGATMLLSRTEDLTLYDAAYLELAIRLGATLASCDKTLVDAARRCGVEVLTV
ncbi:MAG: type II toxin-antitoxin system VapC family toxin [Caulobacter sp.]|nr:type II toxin-antitoxin system VapC family toxin [Caulobacter sp.]